MSPVVLDDLLESLSPAERRAPAPPLSFHEVGCAYPSGRSVGVSFLLHQVALFLVIFSSHYAFVRTVESVPPNFATAVPVDKIYLPTLGGGSEGAGKSGGGSGADEDLSSGVRARSRRGFAYPGAQPLVSDPPHATLGIQTILQPALKNPPLLHQYTPLPNIAKPADVAVAEPPKPVIKVLAGEVALRPSDASIVAPKLTLPVNAASQAPALDASQPIVPKLLPAKPPVPGPAEISEVPVERRNQQALLVLNAVPAPPDVPTRIPSAEARSLFAVAPGEVTVIADPGAGSKGGIQPSMAAGTGTPSDVASGDAIADAPAGGRSANLGGSGASNGGRYGSSKGSGVNSSGSGVGTGRGNSAGSGTGSGPGTTVGSGKGAGSAPGGGGFPGISISGGRYGNGSGAASLKAGVGPHRQTSYSMTITSTASSGGGLADFGVFHDEKVYTVYLDMRATDEDSTPSWTLQYAVLNPPAGPRTAPTPPYVLLKQVPELPPELAAKCTNQLIVASAIMTDAGKLEQVSVKHTPDDQLIAPLTEALSNWSFEPAQVDGKPVALKILLGIHLAAR